MRLPFSREQFFDLFAHYNQSVWPLQLVLIALAVVSTVIVIDTRGADRLVGGFLALLWAWMAFGYHVAFFTRINPAAWFFAAAFVVAAVAFVRHTRSGALVFERPHGVRGAAGALLVLYALGGYPLVGILAGETYPRVPTFGLPCPTTIFTFGILLWARRPLPLGVLLVPLAWAVVGSFAAVGLGVVQDYGLALAGAIAATSLFRRAEAHSPA